MVADSTGLEVRTDVRPPDAVRRCIDGADEVLMCVAFVHASGLNLISAQLPDRRPRRLLSTTAFGQTTAQGLDLARRRGVTARVLNLAGGTFHPKVYLGRQGQLTRAVVGSVNLTAGLVTNIEAVATSPVGPWSRPLTLRRPTCWSVTQS